MNVVYPIYNRYRICLGPQNHKKFYRFWNFNSTYKIIEPPKEWRFWFPLICKQKLDKYDQTELTNELARVGSCIATTQEPTVDANIKFCWLWVWGFKFKIYSYKIHFKKYIIMRKIVILRCSLLIPRCWICLLQTSTAIITIFIYL